MKYIMPILLVLGIQNVLVAQEFSDGLYMIQAIDRVFENSSYLEQNSDFGFDYNTCLLGAFVTKSETVSYSTTLRGGYEYAIIGGGDDDATDVDIYVYDSDDNLIIKDSETDRTPIVRFTPESGEVYTIQLKLYDATANGSFCVMSILREGGYTVPKSNLTTASRNSYDWWVNAENELDVRFHDKGNQWCMFGALLKEGASCQINKIDLGTTDVIMIGTSDNNAEDIDLCITDNSQNSLKCDTKSDNYPIVQYSASNDYYYGMRTKNYSSGSRTALIISTIFTY
jgi:type 1 fimbria pilin